MGTKDGAAEDIRHETSRKNPSPFVVLHDNLETVPSPASGVHLMVDIQFIFGRLKWGRSRFICSKLERPRLDSTHEHFKSVSDPVVRGLWAKQQLHVVDMPL